MEVEIKGKWEDPYTWHHSEKLGVMMPVKQSLHSSASHVGGRAINDDWIDISFVFE